MQKLTALRTECVDTATVSKQAHHAVHIVVGYLVPATPCRAEM